MNDPNAFGGHIGERATAGGEQDRRAAAADAPPVDRTWLHLARRVKALSWLSLAWLAVEGGVGVVAGLLAGSVALEAFGLDSAIEGLASVIVIWRFTGTRIHSDGAERRAQKVVAISFFLLAPYVAAEAVRALVDGSGAKTSWIGIALSVGTLVVCPWLGIAKQRLGARLASDATRGEGRQNLLCAMLAGGVLAGLLARTLFGLWWVDPAVALAIAAVCANEGRTAWHGEPCGCGACAVSASTSRPEPSHPAPRPPARPLLRPPSRGRRGGRASAPNKWGGRLG